MPYITTHVVCFNSYIFEFWSFFLWMLHDCWCLLCLCHSGAENGSSSQGTVGQSGPVAGSTGGVSKASKGQGSAEKEEQAGNQKRARRQWESWSTEDKNSFFEGLYEVKRHQSQGGTSLCATTLNLKVSIYFLTSCAQLWSPAWEGLRGYPEQHCNEVQEKGKASQHGEEQGAGSPLLLPDLAQDLKTHWLCQRWAASLSLPPQNRWDPTESQWKFEGKTLFISKELELHVTCCFTIIPYSLYHLALSHKKSLIYIHAWTMCYFNNSYTSVEITFLSVGRLDSKGMRPESLSTALLWLVPPSLLSVLQSAEEILSRTVRPHLLRRAAQKSWRV